ncbi:DUF6907 domain-containing protein [Streptomyces reticuli]|uniref:DUF6907 domain-containing protein n=1 Tax=Streptomyces reticuli TaxID=1926 RepID=UPI00073DC776|nr:hypothetical protein [Streptomyces sp. SID7810]CUW31748.1 hypothetical protein TUE45_06497 [Streptomyces reticuli]
MKNTVQVSPVDARISSNTAFPAPAPGHRLVPALIGTRKSAHVAPITCPSWCAEDHLATPMMFEDIVHTSASENVGISSFLKQDGSQLMYAMLQVDPTSSDPRLRRAHIGIETDGLPDYHTPEMTDRLADDLIRFALQLRGLAATARAHNEAAGDSDPDMDEALRRARGGVA